MKKTKKTKNYMVGGKINKMSSGGKLKMTTKGMPVGGVAMAKGGKTGAKTIARGSGAARPQPFGKNG